MWQGRGKLPPPMPIKSGGGISRMIEASAEKGLPKIGERMQINAIAPEELH
jgi:hypothetical protein